MTLPVEQFNIMERLIRIETLLEQKHAASDATAVDHETRLRKLERSVWVAGGFAFAGGGTLGAVLAPYVNS